MLWYRDGQHVFAGTCEHHLTAHGDSFLIRHKRVNLINPDAPQKSLIVYL